MSAQTQHKRVHSLRKRVFLLLLSPLGLAIFFLGGWRYFEERKTAEAIFDRALLSVALSISRDIARSNGDILSPATAGIISAAADGKVFYHVADTYGSWLTGYAYPPAKPAQAPHDMTAPFFYDASYRGKAVRVLKMREKAILEGLPADTTVTVWQGIERREAFAQSMGIRTAGLLATMLFFCLICLWLCLKRGLSPLTDLQQAIANRSPDDLSLIRRPVPIEVQGIVNALNHLFLRVDKSIASQHAFISDAAHQLRNPVNALQSTAESLRDAKSGGDYKPRIRELISAARRLTRLTEQLISLDRLRCATVKRARLNVNDLVREVCQSTAPVVLSGGRDFEFSPCADRLIVTADQVLVQEAIHNLIDNAEKHGGQKLSSIHVTTNKIKAMACITVQDDGKGMTPDDADKAFQRFGQLQPSSGSGLGLAIVASIAAQHHGHVQINDSVNGGASVSFFLPLEA